MSQAENFNHLCALTGKSHLDSDYHAAFYLLSCDQELYEAVCKAVTHNGIDFATIKRATCGFDERTRFVVDIAHNLFSYSSACKATPFEISRLGYPLMEQVCNALYIAADQVKVIVQQAENNQDVLVLDDAPYQESKRGYSFMQHLQNEMSDVAATSVERALPDNLSGSAKKPRIADKLAAACVTCESPDKLEEHELPHHPRKLGQGR